MTLSPEDRKSLEFCRKLRRESEDAYRHLPCEESSDIMEFRVLVVDRRYGFKLLHVGEDNKLRPEGWAERRYRELKPIVEARAAKAPGDPAYAGINGNGPAPQGGDGHGPGGGKDTGPGDAGR
jgi:hypothetical protein